MIRLLSISLLIVLTFTACQRPANLLKKDLESWEKKAIAEELVDSAYQVIDDLGYKRAIALIDSANAVHKDAANYGTKARFEARLGRFAKAFADWDTAIEMGNESAYRERGWNKLYFMNDFEGAIADMELYKKKADKKVAFHRAKNLDEFIGVAYKMKGDYKNAIQYFDNCVNEAKKPSWVDVYVLMHRALCYQALGQYEKAKSDLVEMNKQCNSCPEGYYYLAKLLIEENKTPSNEILSLINKAQENKRMLRYWIYHEHTDQVYVEDIEGLLKQVESNELAAENL